MNNAAYVPLIHYLDVGPTQAAVIGVVPVTHVFVDGTVAVVMET